MVLGVPLGIVGPDVVPELAGRRRGSPRARGGPEKPGESIVDQVPGPRARAGGQNRRSALLSNV